MERFMNNFNRLLCLAFLVSMLTSCSHNLPTQGNYDIYIAYLDETDEESNNTSSFRIIKNDSIIFEGITTLYKFFINFEVENGHTYFINVRKDPITNECNHYIYKDLDSTIDLSYLIKPSSFALPIYGFLNEHYIYGNNTIVYNNDPFVMKQFWDISSDFQILENKHEALSPHYLTSHFYQDKETGDIYFAGYTKCGKTPFDVYWKNGEEHDYPNTYYNIPSNYCNFTLNPSIVVYNKKVIFYGSNYYWYDDELFFLNDPSEYILKMISDNGHLYTMISHNAPYEYGRDYYNDEPLYTPIFEHVYIYKDDKLIYENDNVILPKDFQVVDGICFYVALEKQEESNNYTYTIWRNNEKIHESGEIIFNESMAACHNSYTRLFVEKK
ncbi:MAG: hypothetical protein Q4D14_02135 [Bacteroidales bacterium]|nr:hypothetical protein [Bacteroidales bacterium]